MTPKAINPFVNVQSANDFRALLRKVPCPSIGFLTSRHAPRILPRPGEAASYPTTPSDREVARRAQILAKTNQQSAHTEPPTPLASPSAISTGSLSSSTALTTSMRAASILLSPSTLQAAQPSAHHTAPPSMTIHTRIEIAPPTPCCSPVNVSSESGTDCSCSCSAASTTSSPLSQGSPHSSLVSPQPRSASRAQLSAHIRSAPPSSLASPPQLVTMASSSSVSSSSALSTALPAPSRRRHSLTQKVIVVTGLGAANMLRGTPLSGGHPPPRAQHRRSLTSGQPFDLSQAVVASSAPVTNLLSADSVSSTVQVTPLPAPTQLLASPPPPPPLRSIVSTPSFQALPRMFPPSPPTHYPVRASETPPLSSAQAAEVAQKQRSHTHTRSKTSLHFFPHPPEETATAPVVTTTAAAVTTTTAQAPRTPQRSPFLSPLHHPLAAHPKN
jgi:hypothetical protein